MAALFACAARVVARNWGNAGHQNRIIRGDREKDRALSASPFLPRLYQSLEGRVIGEGPDCLLLFFFLSHQLRTPFPFGGSELHY